MADTPKPMQGTWTLIDPSGNRSWQAPSPLACAALEQRERIPPQVALQRILDAADEPTLRERDMAMMIRRLCSHTVNDKARQQAMELLRKHGLQGSPLRAESASSSGKENQ